MNEEEKKLTLSLIAKYGTLTFCLCLIAGGCLKGINDYFGLKPDNLLEQEIEKVLENATGVQYDLSPNDDP